MKSAFVVGDSISMHYGPYLEQYLQGWCGYSRKSDGDAALQSLGGTQSANGGDSSAVLTYLQAVRDVGKLTADTLLVNCGLHDIKTEPASGARQIPINLYGQNLTGIVEIASEMGVELIWIRTTPAVDEIHNKPGSTFHRFTADCAAYNAVADAVMAENGVPAIDLFGFTSRLGDDVFCDHVHFHPHIREKQAAYIAGWLQRHFALKH
ncbi:MAG: SGNH/GDSL hydrolase family protein [Lentisphaeria bacterium]|nr:SGNH/GDSL hydrolase family protein [Lentisphaeria bacterium]